MKRVLSIILVLSISMACSPAAARAAGSCYDVFTAEYISNNGLPDAYLFAADWDGDTLYACLSDGSLYTYVPGWDAQKLCELPPAPEVTGLMSEEELFACVTNIAASDGQIYGFNVYSGMYGLIDEGGVHWQNTVLDFGRLFAEDEDRPSEIVRSFLGDGVLYSLVQTDAFWEQYALHAVDLTTGRSILHDIEGLCGMCRGAQGQFLCLLCVNGEYLLSVFDPLTEELEDFGLEIDLPAPDEGLGGLAYDEEEDAVYLCANNRVYRSLNGEPFAPFARMDMDFLQTTAPAWALPGGRYALWQDGMHIRSFGEDTRRELVVSGYISLHPMESFAEQNSDIDVQYTDWTTADELAKNMTTQDTSIDVYILRADYAFSSLKQKGYAASLSSSGAISDAVSSMDENIAEVLLDANGDIVAFPQSLSLYIQYLHEDYWHMFWPDRPLPATYDELLDAWIDWESNIAQDYPGVGFVNWDFDYATLIYELVSDYVRQHDFDGLPEIDTPALRSALEKAQAICEIRRAKGRSTSKDEPDVQLILDSETGPGSIYWSTMTTPMENAQSTVLSHESEYLYGVQKGDSTPHQILFDESSMPQTSAMMYVFILNPFSAHADEALRFIEWMTLGEADQKLYYAIHPGLNEPCENPDYEYTRTNNERQKAYYEDAIQRAKDANQDYDPDWENRLMYYTDWLTNESERWTISRETLDAFRAMVQSAPLNVHAESPYVGNKGTDAYRIIMDACTRYASGNLTMDSFLREISSRMQMIYWENQ